MISSSLLLSPGQMLRGPVCRDVDQPACQARAYTREGRCAPQKQGWTGVLGRAGAVLGRRVLRARHTLCCLGATAALLGLPGVVRVQAQEVPAAAPARIPPSPGETMSAYQSVRAWVRSGSVPDVFDADGSLPACAGASVVLMHGGEVIGRSSELARSDDVPGRVIWRAVRASLSQALAHARAQRPRGEGPAWSEVAEGVTISLELAGALVPMSKDELLAIEYALSPGIDGIAARRGDRVGAVFPGEILRRNSGASRAIASLTGAIAGDARAGLEPVGVLLGRGYVYYRFRTTHVAQPAPGGAAVFLQRGGRLINRTEITRGSMYGFAHALAERIERNTWPGVEPLGVLGAYDPIRGRLRDRLASPLEQAMSALALTRYATTPGVGPERRARALRRSRAILEDLAQVEAGEVDPRSELIASAACIVALDALFRADPTAFEQSERLQSLSECAETLDSAWVEGEGFVKGLPPGSQGLLALAKLRSPPFGSISAETIREGEAWVLAAYRDTPQGLLVSQMPWLGWASQELASMSGEPIGAADVLREMRELVWEHQIRGVDLDVSDQDLSGGIVFTKGRNPLPTWQGARPLAFLASMLGDERLTSGGLQSGEVPGEIGRLLDSVRFLRQLAAGEHEGHMYKDPERAAWGVRKSLWDQTMEPGATTMTLMVICETLRSVERVASRPSGD